MKNNRLLLVAFAVFTLIACTEALPALAQRVAQQDSANWIQQRVAKRVVERIEQRLNVTQQQREQAKAILQQERPTILALAQQAQQERAELAALPGYDEPQVRQITQRYAATNADIAVERAKVRLEMRAILTPAQRQQADELRAHVSSHLAERIDRLGDLL